MASEFILLRLRTDESEERGWKHAVSVSQIVSILPIHSETSGDPATAKEDTFYRARPKDDADAAGRGLSVHYQVVDTSGNVYLSAAGINQVNVLLSRMYQDATK
jgi:hypothetical protein